VAVAVPEAEVLNVSLDLTNVPEYLVPEVVTVSSFLLQAENPKSRTINVIKIDWVLTLIKLRVVFMIVSI
jgi:hypothetical protein